MSSLQYALDPSLMAGIQAANSVSRKGRYPVHNHLVQFRPWQIKPFMIAPVFPGDTMKRLTHTSRTITDPLKVGPGNLLPWWVEHYYFYVKVRQCGEDVFNAYKAMVLQGTPITINDPADVPTNHNGKGINWAKRALDFVVEEGGFRNAGEAVGTKIDGLPLAAAMPHKRGWHDSLKPALNVDPADDITPDNNDLENPHQYVMPELLQQYEQMRSMRFIDMTFDDWLEMHGVNIPAPDTDDKPELVRLSNSWVYPSNTIDPTNGTPTGVAMFNSQFSGDKDRFFKEPGFLVGITLARPKIFLGNQESVAANTFLNTAHAWSPRLLADQPHISIKGFKGGASANGPLKGQTLGYWVDVRDLFLHGDQFVDQAAAAGYSPALPNADGEKRFATAAMMDALFQTAATNKIRQDGTTRLSILSHPSNATDNT